MSFINIESDTILKDRATIFYNNFLKNLNSNLNDRLILSVSNLVSIDYIHRLKEQININEYINLCIARIKTYLGYKVITEKDFNTAMGLFIVAITPEPSPSNNDEKNLIYSKDVMIESIISSLFIDMSLGEQLEIKSIIHDLIDKEGKDFLNFIGTEPKLFYSIINYAVKNKQPKQELDELIQTQIKTTLPELQNLERKIVKSRNLFAKIAIVGSILISGVIGSAIGGLMLPAVIIPAAALSVKYGPVLSKNLALNLPSVKKERLNIKNKILNKQIQLDNDIEEDLDINFLIENERHAQIIREAKDIAANINQDISIARDTDEAISKKNEIKKPDLTKNFRSI